MAAAAHHSPGAAQPDLRQQMCWPRSLRELLVSRDRVDLRHCRSLWPPVQCPVLSFLSLMDLSRLNRMVLALEHSCMWLTEPKDTFEARSDGDVNA